MKIEKCRKCPAKIVWLYTKNQKPIPVNADTVKPGDVEYDETKGHVTHFRTCEFAKEFKRKKPAAASAPAKPEKKVAPAAAQQEMILF